jgi:hypothetical protein
MEQMPFSELKNAGSAAISAQAGFVNMSASGGGVSTEAPLGIGVAKSTASF